MSGRTFFTAFMHEMNLSAVRSTSLSMTPLVRDTATTCISLYASRHFFAISSSVRPL